MNRTRLLFLLFLILLSAAWYAWQETPRQQRITNVADQNKGTVSVEISRENTEDDLDFSGGKKLEFITPKRDLFRSLYRKPVVAQIVQPPPPPKKPVPELPKPVFVPPPPPPPPPVQQTSRVKPIPVFRVLGFLEKEADVTVFLAGSGGDIHLVKRGDRFADDLLVRELDITKIVISRGMDDHGVTLKVSEPKVQRMEIQNVPSGRPDVPVIQEQGQKKPASGAG